MIDLYYWPTSNGRKISIMLEEVDLPYELHLINISKDDQFKPEFVAINPNSKIPAIVDREGPEGRPYTLFESGAILIYLAEKTGRFMPTDTANRFQVIQWLMFQMGGIGPMFGQVHHFRQFKDEEQPYGKKRYGTELRRLYGVLDAHLAKNEYMHGDYSIADMAIFPWVVRYEWHPIKWGEEFGNVKRWFDAIAARPAVQRALKVGVGG